MNELTHWIVPMSLHTTVHVHTLPIAKEVPQSIQFSDTTHCHWTMLLVRFFVIPIQLFNCHRDIPNGAMNAMYILAGNATLLRSVVVGFRPLPAVQCHKSITVVHSSHCNFDLSFCLYFLLIITFAT